MLGTGVCDVFERSQVVRFRFSEFLSTALFGIEIDKMRKKAWTELVASHKLNTERTISKADTRTRFGRVFHYHVIIDIKLRVLYTLEMRAPHFKGSPANLDLLCILACVVISVLAILVTNPIAEASFNDDWAYALSVREMANGSGIHFHGWETSLNFIQVAWAALWVKIFGYSLTLIRLSTLAMTAGCAATLYSLFRTCGVVPSRSVIGTCAITLSPVFVAVGTSFMTDVPSLFFLLLIISNFVRTTKHADSPFIGWCCFATLSAWVLGFNRQTLWFVPLAVLPCLAYTQPQAKKWRPVLLLLWIASVVVIVAAFRWQAQQPYNIQDSASLMIKNALAEPRYVVFSLEKFILSFFLLTLPLFTFSHRFWDLAKHLPRGWRWGIGVTSLVLAVIGYLIPQKYQQLFAPWDKFGNMVTTQGLLTSEMLIGERITVLSPVIVFFLNFGVFFLVIHVCFVAIRSLSSQRHEWKSCFSRVWTETPPAVQFLFSFCLLYTVLLIPRILSNGAFDRYHLPLITLAALWIFYIESKHNVHARFSGQEKWAAGLLLIWGGFGIAMTHDYVAMMRNQAGVAAWLEKQGIARTRISAGWEYDFTTQVRLTRFLNEPRVVNPPGAYRDLPDPKPVTVGNIILAGGWWAYAAPDVHPEYFVTHNMSIPNETPIKTQQYRIWLSPKVQRVDAYFLPHIYSKAIGRTGSSTVGEIKKPQH